MAAGATYDFAGFLGELWKADIPLDERRRLAARACGQAQASRHPPGDGRRDVLDRLEEVLAVAGQSLGVPKPNVTTVKSVLRARGRGDLASRLSRLSKGRNAMAHPDVGLSTELREALATVDATMDTHVALER